eukprot:819474-Pelagomonas_calceolata.AAC.1
MASSVLYCKSTPSFHHEHPNGFAVNCYHPQNVNVNKQQWQSEAEQATYIKERKHSAPRATPPASKVHHPSQLSPELRQEAPDPIISLRPPSSSSATYIAIKRKDRKEKTTQTVKTLPTSTKERRVPRAEAPSIPFTKRNKRNKSKGIRRVTGSNLCLMLVTRVGRSLLKSASESVLDGMGMKLQSKPARGGCMGTKTKLFKRLQSVGS